MKFECSKCKKLITKEEMEIVVFTNGVGFSCKDCYKK